MASTKDFWLWIDCGSSDRFLRSRIINRNTATFRGNCSHVNNCPSSVGLQEPIPWLEIAGAELAAGKGGKTKKAGAEPQARARFGGSSNRNVRQTCVVIVLAHTAPGDREAQRTEPAVGGKVFGDFVQGPFSGGCATCTVRPSP